MNSFFRRSMLRRWATCLCALAASFCSTAAALEVVQRVAIEYSKWYEHFRDADTGAHISMELPAHAHEMPVEERCDAFVKRVANHTAAPPPRAPPDAALFCKPYQPIR
jgi:hypothetical protein